LNVLRSDNKQEFVKIAFYKNRGCRDFSRYDGWDWQKVLDASESLISLDTSNSSVLCDVLTRAPETASFYMYPNEKLKLRVFIDKSVVEVFANNRQCVAARVYPGMEDSVGVSICSRGNDCFVEKLKAWKLNSIYA
jgi:beta-fructofuranosidase